MLNSNATFYAQRCELQSIILKTRGLNGTSLIS